MECKIHIQKIHPLLAGVLIEKTCGPIDKNDDAGQWFHGLGMGALSDWLGIECTTNADCNLSWGR
jgi:hypothetical protein